ncbi:hypothetical protein [Turkeypox virus]|uniref:Uncharacterized protein n=1 Tax=Turkeypox virus TaxID=336486 RepID=A0A0M3ZJP9_9POXV|nr:hypothetical protein ASN15_gp129 [Turkeypox virus]ALA62503.1 hypothetical protein [Turkeypox virus]
MTGLLVTDIANEYSLTTLSEDRYPRNKEFEITNGQITALKNINILLKARINNIDGDLVRDSNDEDDGSICTLSEIDTVINYDNNTNRHVSIENDIGNKFSDEQRDVNIQSSIIPTPSLSATYDDTKRVHLLEQEVVELRKKKLKSKNLLDFTNSLFNKNPLNTGMLNKRAIILNYASVNNTPLDMEDLEACEDEEIDNMYFTIKQYHEVHKKKLIVTNLVSILISILEQVLTRLGFDEIKGLSKEISSELIDLEIGEDCEQLATKMGIANNPVLNISLFILKIFIKRINIL